MVATIYSTLVMGAILVGLAVWIARGRSWREYKPERFTGLLTPGETSPSMDPITAFFLLLLGSSAIGVGIVLVLGAGDPLVTAGAFFAPMIVSYLVAGVYIATKGRSGSSAGAAAMAAVAIGGLTLIAILGKLLFAG